MLNPSLQGPSAFGLSDRPAESASASVATGFLAAVLISLIGVYRRFVSPLLGPHCRFHPTCSSYAVDAIRRYGPFTGSARALMRLARCHPLSDGGYDPLT